MISNALHKEHPHTHSHAFKIVNLTSREKIANNGANIKIRVAIVVKCLTLYSVWYGVQEIDGKDLNFSILQKENAVDDFRELIGSTNPEEAAEGTIRKLYAKSIDANAIHGSDSNKNAEIEGSFHFSKNQIF